MADDVLLRVKVQRDAAAKSILAETQREIETLTASTKRLSEASRENAAASRQVAQSSNQAVQGYRQVRTAAQLAAETAHLLPDSLKRSARDTAVAAQEAARALTAGLRREFALAQADTKEALARGLITEAEARQRGEAAGKAFNDGVLTIIQQQGTTGGLSGRQGQSVFLGLANQLKSVDEAASKASLGGLKELSTRFATIGLQQIGFRTGMGSIISTLGQFAVGASLTLGVTAGLAAIGLGIRKIKEAADAADAPLKRLAERAEEIRKARLAPFETVGDIAESGAAAANQLDELVRIQKRLNAARAERDALPEGGLRTARDVEIEGLIDRRTAALKEYQALQGRISNFQSQRDSEAKDRRDQEITDLAAIFDLHRETTGDVARRGELLRTLNDELIAAEKRGTNNEEQRQKRTEDIAKLAGQINTLRQAGVEKSREQKSLDREALDLALARLTLETTRVRTQVAAGGLTEAQGLQAEIALLEERQAILAKQVPLAEAAAAALRTPEARAAVASMRQELEGVNLELAQARARTVAWRDQLSELQLEDEIARADPVQAFQLQFERSYGELRRTAGEVGEQFFSAMFNAGLAKAKIEEMLVNVQPELTRLSREGATLQVNFDTGAIDRNTFLQERLRLLGQERAAIARLLPDLREQVRLSKDPESLAALEEWERRFIALQVPIHDVRTAMEEWKLTVLSISEDALEGLFSDLMSGTKSVQDAFLRMAQGILQSLNQIIAKAIATRIATAFLGGGGGPAAGAGRFLLGVGFAQGGMVRGPGTSNSDSIPAWLSNGEYVVRASKVRVPAVRAVLDEINYGHRPFRAPLRDFSRLGFSEGGLVDRPPLAAMAASASIDGRVDVGLEDGLVLKHLQSDAGMRTLLRVVANNRRAFRRVLD